MKNIKKITIMCSLFLLTILIPVTSSSSFPCTVRGYVYADNELCIPEDIVLSFPDKSINANIYEDGYFIFDFEANHGDVGFFNVTLEGKIYTADETIIIQNETYSYKINLNITVSDEEDTEPPSKVTGLTVTDAKDGKLDLSWNPATDNVAVAFYNIFWDQNSYTTPITTVTHPTTTYQHTGLTNGQTYCYKISAVDTSDNEGEKSDVACGMSTASSTINNPPEKPSDPNPANNSEDTSLNPQLSVYVQDPNGDSMTVSFYNVDNDELIGTIANVENASRAAFTWPSLSFNTTYNWYAVANDSEFETRSDVFCFKTIKEEDDNTAPVVFFETPQEGGLYVFGNNIFSGILKTPLIIGSLNIVVNATDNQSGISHVTLSIKGKWQNITQNLTTSPYTYEWSSFGFKTYNITATAYDNAGNSASTNIIVRKFL